MQQAVRRSGRPRVKPDIFVAGPSKRVEFSEDPKDDSDIDDIKSTDSGYAPPTKKNVSTPARTGKKKRTKKKQPRKIKKGDEGELLSALKDPNVAVVQLVNDLLGEDEDKIASKLLRFVLECCGCNVGTINEEFEEKELEDIDLTLELDRMNEFCARVAESPDCFTQNYVLKDVPHFPKTLTKFWKILVEEGGETFVEGDLLPFLLDNLAVVSSVSMLSFRYTATFSCAVLGEAMIDLSQDLTRKLFSASKQLGTKVKTTPDLAKPFETLNKAFEWFCLPQTSKAAPSTIGKDLESCMETWRKSSGSAAPQLTDTVDRVSKNIVAINEHMKATLMLVLKERHVDIHPVIRSCVVKTCAEWISKEPTRYLNTAKIFIEKLLLDKVDTVREASCQALAKALDSGNRFYSEDTAQNRQRLQAHLRKAKQEWATRTRPILTETLLNDKSPPVVVATLQTLQNMLGSTGKFHLDEERAIEQCLCVVGDEYSEVRKEAAKFVVEASFTVGENEDDSQNTASAIARARVHLAELIEMINNLVSNRTGDDNDEEMDIEETDSNSNTKAVELLCLPDDLLYPLVKAFWGLPQGRFLRNFDALFVMLQNYGENDITGELGEFKARSVAGILRASAKCASDPPEETLSKREKKKYETEQEDLMDSLHNALSKYLTDCLNTFRSDVHVLKSITPLVRNISPVKCIKDIERKGLEKLCKTLTTLVSLHNDPDLLFLISETLANHLCFGSDIHPVQTYCVQAWKDLFKEICEKVTSCCKTFLDEATEESEVALTNNLRRLGIIMRIPEHQTGISEVLFELCSKVVRRATQKQQEAEYEALLCELLVVFQVEIELQLRDIIAEVQDSKESNAYIEGLLDNAKAAKDKVVSCIDSVLSCSTCLEDGSKLAAAMTYNDLRLLCSSQLQNTILHPLAMKVNLFLDNKASEVCGNQLLEEKDNGTLLAVIVRSTLYCDKGNDTLPSRLLRNITKTDDNAFTKAAKVISSTLKQTRPDRLLELHLSTLQDVHASKEYTSKQRLSLAEKLAKTVSHRERNCPAALVKPAMELLGAGVRFALKRPNNVTFLQLLIPYVKVLRPGEQIEDTRKMWEGVLDEMMTPEVAKKIFGEKKQRTRRTLLEFEAFEKALGVKTQPKEPSEDDEEVEEIKEVKDDEENQTRKRRKTNDGSASSDDDEEANEKKVQNRAKRDETKQEGEKAEHSDSDDELSKTNNKRTRGTVDVTGGNADDVMIKKKPKQEKGESGDSSGGDTSPTKKQKTGYSDGDESTKEVEKNLFATSDVEDAASSSKKLPVKPASVKSSRDNALFSDEDEEDEVIGLGKARARGRRRER